jgi:hypothetical protein
MSRNHRVGSWYPVILVEMGPWSAAGDIGGDLGCGSQIFRAFAERAPDIVR